MKYENAQKVIGTLVSAPVLSEGFAFVKPDGAVEESENIYVAASAVRVSGLDVSDIGCRVAVWLRVGEADSDVRTFGTRLERADDRVGDEELDAVEREVFRRLAKLERMVARLAQRPVKS